jgi:hypothetical protein
LSLPVVELTPRFAPLLTASFLFPRWLQSTVNEYDRSYSIFFPTFSTLADGLLLTSSS